MKITRHTAKDMRQALRLVRDQLGADAVILTSKRTPFGVEVTAAVDFDAARIEAQAQGAPSGPSSDPRTFRPDELVPPPPAQVPARREQDPYTIADSHGQAEEDVQQSLYARLQAEMLGGVSGSSGATATARATNGHGRNSDVKAAPAPAPARAVKSHSFARIESAATRIESAAARVESPAARIESSAARVDAAAARVESPAARVESAATRVESAATRVESAATRVDAARYREAGDDVHSALESAIDSYMAADDVGQNDAHLSAAVAGANQPNRAHGVNRANTAHSANTLHSAHSAGAGNATDADGFDTPEETSMGAELKAMRRILETQMAQLAWNDLTRRAPIHTEILRELTEVGLTQEFAAQIVAQLPLGTDMTKARRLSIALISQRLSVTGDRWLDTGGRVALIGPTGVGKTTALAKLAVRWVLRHGARSLALISADSVRIGAHDQMQALGQMLDVPVHIAETLAEIPQLLERLGAQRFVLVDTPGMSQRDAQLATRMMQLAQAGHGLETALVLAASTQAGAIAETVARFSTANATSVLLTKVDEAASLGGILSVLTRADLPISYVSEGQRVPEDLRPARALELVSSAVQLAKSSGAAADEDMLRRRYGDVAHALA